MEYVLYAYLDPVEEATLKENKVESLCCLLCFRWLVTKSRLDFPV